MSLETSPVAGAAWLLGPGVRSAAGAIGTTLPEFVPQSGNAAEIFPRHAFDRIGGEMGAKAHEEHRVDPAGRDGAVAAKLAQSRQGVLFNIYEQGADTAPASPPIYGQPPACALPQPPSAPRSC